MQDDRGHRPLHLAALNGHVEVVTTLVQLGSDVNVRDAIGASPLHFAARNGHAEVVATQESEARSERVRQQRLGRREPTHCRILHAPAGAVAHVVAHPYASRRGRHGVPERQPALARERRTPAVQMRAPRGRVERLRRQHLWHQPPPQSCQQRCHHLGL